MMKKSMEIEMKKTKTLCLFVQKKMLKFTIEDDEKNWWKMFRNFLCWFTRTKTKYKKLWIDEKFNNLLII